MNPLGTYVLTNELLARNERQAAAEDEELRRRPDALPDPEERGLRTQAGGWLARILAGHQPPAARRKGAHI